jgi:hypothetical protein
LELQSPAPVPEAEADGNCVESEVDVQGEQTVENGACPIRQSAGVRELHRTIDDTAPGDANTQRNIENHDEKLAILVSMQLTDGGKFKGYAEEDACEQPEQIRGSFCPGVPQAEYKLKINDQFKEKEVWRRHIFDI